MAALPPLAHISLLVVLATAFGLLSTALQLPVVVGYLLLGLILPLVGIKSDLEITHSLSEIGILLLLFLAGLELKPRLLQKAGGKIFRLGLIQIGGAFLLGWFLFKFGFGENLSRAAFLALALVFNSTVVVLRLLSERRETRSPHGLILIGLMLLQDLIAVALLTFLNQVNSSGVGKTNTFFTLVFGVLLLGLIFNFGRYFLPHLLNLTSREGLGFSFLVGLSWALISAQLCKLINFSPEAGAFIAGLSLSASGSLVNFDIESNLRPLRDLGLALFFVTLAGGRSWDGWSIGSGLLLGLMSLFLSPLLIYAAASFLHLPRRTHWLLSLIPGQSSEFALIYLTAAAEADLVPSSFLPVFSISALLSMSLSSLILRHFEKIFYFFSSMEKKKNDLVAASTINSPSSPRALVLGLGFDGLAVARFLRKQGWEVWGCDWEIDKVNRARQRHIKSFCLDVNDTKSLLPLLEEVQLVISTIIYNREGDEMLFQEIEEIKQTRGQKIELLVVAPTQEEAKQLKKAGLKHILIVDEILGEGLEKLVQQIV